ncbi:MAG: HAD family hydrolase [Methylobacteriaceae bacterium]|nr:HAD family hydrolase [Methylobacteriaceae bacterium]
MALLRLAASAEQGSEHALGRAIVTRAKQDGVDLLALDSFEAKPGRGLEARLGERLVYIGNRALMRDVTVDVAPLVAKAEEIETRGGTAFFVAVADRGSPHLVGLVATSDELRPKPSERSNVFARSASNPSCSPATARRSRAPSRRNSAVSTSSPACRPKARLPKYAACGRRPHRRHGRRRRERRAAAGEADVGIAMGAGSETALEAASVALPGDDLPGRSR